MKNPSSPLTIKNLLYVLCFIGLGVSMYLVYTKLTSSPIYCRLGDCQKVQNSSYSSLFGIPVSYFGVGFYFLLFVLFYKNYLKLAKIWLAWGVAFSVYLTYLELYVIKAICMWCITSFVVIILAALVTYFIKEEPRT